MQLDGQCFTLKKDKVCSICIKHKFKHGLVSFHQAKKRCEQEQGSLLSEIEVQDVSLRKIFDIPQKGIWLDYVIGGCCIISGKGYNPMSAYWVLCKSQVIKDPINSMLNTQLPMSRWDMYLAGSPL